MCEVINMDGKFYAFDDWLHMITEKDNKELSEGAKWWLSRIATKKLELPQVQIQPVYHALS
jgi:hypothetical protein